MYILKDINTYGGLLLYPLLRTVKFVPNSDLLRVVHSCQRRSCLYEIQPGLRDLPIIKRYLCYVQSNVLYPNISSLQISESAATLNTCSEVAYR